MLFTPCAYKIYRCSSKKGLGPLKENQGALFLEINGREKIGGQGMKFVDFFCF